MYKYNIKLRGTNGDNAIFYLVPDPSNCGIAHVYGLSVGIRVTRKEAFYNKIAKFILSFPMWSGEELNDIYKKQLSAVKTLELNPNANVGKCITVKVYRTNRWEEPNLGDYANIQAIMGKSKLMCTDKKNGGWHFLAENSDGMFKQIGEWVRNTNSGNYISAFELNRYDGKGLLAHKEHFVPSTDFVS